MGKHSVAIIAAAAILLSVDTILVKDACAQTQTPQASTQGGPQAVAPPPSAYPARPAGDPAVVAQGKASFSVRCAFCHGSDARGGESGPNLLRSELVLTDKDGENIIPVVQHGRPALGMPAFELTVAQVQQIVIFLHSLSISGNERGRTAPIRIPLGDATSGKLQFDSKCASCHTSASLQGIASRVPDPRALQQTWLLPGGRGGATDLKIPPKRVSIAFSDGKKLSGRLQRMDDFIVTLISDQGETITVARHGAVPQVSLIDPLAGHTKLLPSYTDANIHDITAYLETMK